MTLSKVRQLFLVLVAAFILVVGLAGCSGSDTSNSSNSSSGSSDSYEEETTAEDEVSLEEEDSSLSSSSSVDSEYRTLDPDWRSSTTNGYRTFDTSMIDDWQVPTPEIEDLVNRINAKYDLELDFIETQEDLGGWRYFFQDTEAQDDPYGGDSLSIKVMPETGMYAAMGLYCVNADDAVGASEMIAEVFGYDTYPIDEVETISNDPDADEGSVNHYEGGPVYEWAYSKDAGGNSLEQGISFIAFAFA